MYSVLTEMQVFRILYHVCQKKVWHKKPSHGYFNHSTVQLFILCYTFHLHECKAVYAHAARVAQIGLYILNYFVKIQCFKHNC